MTQVTLPEAAKILGKSLQTIRRFVKTKRLQSIKEATPQGFIYRVNVDELKNLSGELSTDQPPIQSTIQNDTLDSRNHTGINLDRRRKNLYNKENPNFRVNKKRARRKFDQSTKDEKIGKLEVFFQKETSKLNTIIERLVKQGKTDKENLFGVIKAFQDRIVLLENHIKFLEAPKKKWWKFW